MSVFTKRLREPSTHSALAVAGLSLLPTFGVSQEITMALAVVLSAFGIILPEAPPPPPAVSA